MTTSRRLPITSERCYTLHLSSPLMDNTHLEKLARAVQQFVTPTQCGNLVTSTIQILDGVQGRYKKALKSSEEDGSRKKKKRKSEAAIDHEEALLVAEDDVDNLAVAYALASRIAQIVLGSVPLHNLPADQAEEVRTSASQFYSDFVQHHVGRLAKTVLKQNEGSEKDLGNVSSKKKRKQRSEEVVEANWASQIVLCALLKLQYALERAANLALPMHTGEEEGKVTKRIVGLLKLQQHVLPELVLELVGSPLRILLQTAHPDCHQSRHLLLHCTQMDPSAVPAVFEPILAHIEAGIPSISEANWSGKPHELSLSSTGSPTLGLALMHLVLERWLPAVE
jgi:hypothetical protein